VANTDHEQQERQRRRERQYAIDRITARYAAEYRAGQSPRLDEYLQRYPEFAAELIDFVLYFHSIAVDLPAPDAVPTVELSPAARAAQARLRTRFAPAIEGLVKQGRAAGYTPSQLAAAVGLSLDVLAKLEGHVIEATTIPRALIQRLASALQTAPDAIVAYLSGHAPAQAGAFFYADKPPDQRQQTFLEAIRASGLPPERKREWEDIVRSETGE